MHDNESETMENNIQTKLKIEPQHRHSLRENLLMKLIFINGNLNFDDNDFSVPQS